jgi:methionine sulfoxide reductase heme-binding subunit
MTRPVGWGVVVGIVGLMMIDAVATRAGVIASTVPRSDAPWLWVTSRAAGVAAFAALTLDVAFGLFLSTGAADRWIARARSVEVHRWLSSATLAMLALHVLALLGDGFARFDVLDALVPFVASYRPLSIALGVLAAYLVVGLHVSFAIRQRIGMPWWRRLHRWSYAAFVGGMAHGILAGSDTNALGILVLYAVAAISTGWLLGQRLLRSGAPASQT